MRYARNWKSKSPAYCESFQCWHPANSVTKKRRAWRIARLAIDLEGRYPLPNIISIVENLMEATSPPMRIGRRTILSILKAAPEPQALLDNPHEFASALVGIVKTKLADQLVGGTPLLEGGGERLSSPDCLCSRARCDPNYASEKHCRPPTKKDL